MFVTQPTRRSASSVYGGGLQNNTAVEKTLMLCMWETMGITGQCVGTGEHQPFGKEEQDANNTFPK